MEEKAVIITRLFQRGAGKSKDLDKGVFEKAALKIGSVLNQRDPSLYGSIIVVTNGDQSSNLSEGVDPEGKTPTIRALEEYFPRETSSGIIVPLVCKNWGLNPGSGNALNLGLARAKENDVPYSHAIMWSTEMDFDVDMIARGMLFASELDLSVLGFARERWWERAQWNVAQNTLAIWLMNHLLAIKGFDPRCNGVAGDMIKTEQYGDVQKAGMEDFHAILRLMKALPEFKWGMFGNSSPLKWAGSHFQPGTEAHLDHLKKVARQYLVMQAWAEEIYPNAPFEEVMDYLFSKYHLGN